VRSEREPFVEILLESGSRRFGDTEGVEAFAARAFFKRR
jgi:hypothetical protein